MNKSDNKKILLKHKYKFILKFIISILLNVFLLIIPIYYSKIIDSLSDGLFNQTIIYLSMFGLLTILYRFIDYFNQKAYFYLYLSLYKSYMQLGINKTFNNSLYSLSRFSLSEYSNILSEDFEMVSDYYSTLVIRIVEILEFIYIIVYFFFLNKIIGLITLITSLIIIFILFYFNKNISNINILRKNKNDKRISLFQEIFLSIKTIKGFNIHQAINKRLDNTINDYTNWHSKLNMTRYLLREVTLGIIDITKIISLFIGIKLIINNYMTLGTITIIYSYYTKLSELFTSIIVLSESLNNKEVSLKRIEKLFQYANNHIISKSDYNDIKGNITFKNILYGNKISPYLDNVSFNIKGNSLTLVTGNNNSCNAIFDLLLRYNKAHSGNILIDNVNIDLYSNENISNIIGFIMEYPKFFNTSIKENLELFDNNFENILSICKYLEIDKIIEKMDNGYETIMDSNINDNLKYMLAIARIFIKKSKIILINNILDHVRGNTYKKILDIIINLKKEHTIIMITNNKSLLENDNVDQIIYLNNKKVLGVGKHDDLINNNENYQNYYKDL